MNSIQAKTIKIVDYLYSQGIEPKKIQGNNYWYSSPLRKEETPSFKVDCLLNVWYDHGSGKGGNILDLVMAIHNLPNISAALSHLSKESNSFSFQQQDILSSSDKRDQEDKAIQVIKEIPISHPALIDYIQSRHIDLTVAQLYCKEIHYQVQGKNYFAVGFPNDKGGYELSHKSNNESTFKASVSPKHITTIRNSKDTCIVFEGFMDYLSYLTMKNIQHSKADTVILNSISNLSKAIDFITSHQKVYTYLDNDQAGKNATQQISKTCKAVIDKSTDYANYKDLNEWLCKTKLIEKEQQVQKQEQIRKPSRGFRR
ncbi:MULTISPECIES: toprim domain-containing protein [unclassified Dysgonomonas]|uniref:toprim domain-containing protein n=1 Tax=unclassified Dysgonomonas TaxID=2630389 RepID=UPI0013ECA132|nr:MULTISPECIES: toprim domain-containing protein [unclassified Dysgonomonas]